MEPCVFCQLINKTIPAAILYEDELLIAIPDRNPIAPEHILLIPKTHYDSLNEVPESEEVLISHLLFTARKIAIDQGIGASGYRLVVNTGKQGGQSVFHLHVHLLGGKPLGVDLITRGLQ